MDTILKNLYLRLDANASTLTKNAIGQILVKILFSIGGKASKKDLYESYAKLNGLKKANEPELDEVLANLLDHDINYRKGEYYLSKSKSAKIRKSLEESESRKKEIVETYFSKLHTDAGIVEAWLQDTTIKFFELFSDEWISDLVTGHKAVCRSEASIKDMVVKKTAANKSLDKRDIDVLPRKFFAFVDDNQSIVNEYLWEYGTSAFAAKLIKNRNGVDSITLDAFRNSTCILDTNILLFIALDSKFQDGIVALEKVFADLDIHVGYLYITKKEYQDKVLSKRFVTLHNLDKCGYELTSIANDDFTKCAIELRCKTKEDFERFFDKMVELPEFVHDTVEIELIDDSKELNSIIEKAQADQSKINHLNELFRNLTGRDRKPNPLPHDVGLLTGVEYLRRSNKHFIISEEICVNMYSKERPLSDNLPLAIRIDTLINVLAANNGGDTFDAADYVPLFAKIIRDGLIPAPDTFRQEELYDLYDMDEQIAQLPKDNAKAIAMEMHDLRMQGKKEDELRRELKTKITKGKIKIVSDLDYTKQALSMTEKEKNRQKEQKDLALTLLEKEIRKQEESEYDKQTKSMINHYRYNIPLVIIVATTIFIILKYLDKLSIGWVATVILALIANGLTNLITNVFILKSKIIERRNNKEKIVNDIVRTKLSDLMKK